MAAPARGTALTAKVLADWINGDFNNLVRQSAKWSRENMPTNRPPLDSAEYQNWLKVIGPRRSIPNVSFQQGNIITAEGLFNIIHAICENWRYIRLVRAQRRTFNNTNGDAITYNGAEAQQNTQEAYAYVTEAYKGQEPLQRGACNKGDIISVSALNTMMTNAKNRWANSGTVSLLWDDCHANCHNSCHGSGGWR